MDHNVPGIETADYDVVEVEHTVEALTELFSGAKVVCNTVGPFAKFGPEVVEACVAAGCHYLDTTGEQDWMMPATSSTASGSPSAGLLLSPGIAQMYTTGEIAANIALETPGLDTLDMLVLLEGHADLRLDADDLRQRGALEGPLPRAERVRRVARRRTALHRRGARPARDGPRAALGRHVAPGVVQARPARGERRVLGGVFDQDLMQGVPAIVGSDAGEDRRHVRGGEASGALRAASGVNSQMPPRENQRINISVDSVIATGPMGHVHCVLQGTCNYKQTGLLRRSRRTT
jgi:hypothetical protein